MFCPGSSRSAIRSDAMCAKSLYLVDKTDVGRHHVGDRRHGGQSWTSSHRHREERASSAAFKCSISSNMPLTTTPFSNAMKPRWTPWPQHADLTPGKKPIHGSHPSVFCSCPHFGQARVLGTSTGSLVSA